MINQVFAGALDSNRLQVLVDMMRVQARFAIVERIDAIDFPPPQTAPIEVSLWTKGRVFDESFELRWEHTDPDYVVILATENELPIAESQLVKSDLPLGTSEPAMYYCWNEENPRLGRTLDYRCVPGKGDVELTVREYRDNHGRLIFWRYSKMERDGGAQ
jgi:hypothetical protein